LAFLSVIKDLYDNSIVSYETARIQDYGLVDRSIKAAGEIGGVVLHSDQGYQYTSYSYSSLTKEYEITPSMSRPGTPLDNACAETFFSTIKMKMIYQEHFKTKMQAQAAIFEYIEVYYNRQRRNAASGNIPPCEFRRRYLKKIVA
jgi:putative transposase